MTEIVLHVLGILDPQRFLRSLRALPICLRGWAAVIACAVDAAVASRSRVAGITCLGFMVRATKVTSGAWVATPPTN